jgi:hypothetical protein
MPLKDGSLTRGEAAFIAAYVETGDREKAERSAGLMPKSGYAVLARAEIQTQIRAQQLARLTAEALPMAVSTVIEIMQSTKAPAAARVQAAKLVIDRALPAGEGGQTKELHELTPDELASAIATLETQAASMARPVGPSDPGATFE